MILKGSQRSGGQDLAAHLMRGDENDHVELHEIRGFIANDLSGAFKEAYAVSRATRCRQYLFSLSLNPPETERVTIDSFRDAIERAERKLGLEGQPRAIVFHEKEGRRHAHAVWSRIDAETMTARQLSHFKTKLTDLSRDLYHEHGWSIPRGLADKSARDPTSFTLAEWQQAKRTGSDPRDIKRAIQDAWSVSDNRNAFLQALGERGFHLAKGDRRGHVVLDHTGEVYALTRTTGLKARELRARLGDESKLPSVEQTQRQISDRMTPKMAAHVTEARRAHEHQMAKTEFAKLALRDRQRRERAELAKQHEQRAENEARSRAERLPRGLRHIWAWVTGRLAAIRTETEADAQRCRARDRSERQILIDRHLSERRIVQNEIRALRDRQARLLAELRRDVMHYRAIGLDEREPQRTDRGKARDRTHGINVRAFSGPSGQG